MDGSIFIRRVIIETCREHQNGVKHGKGKFVWADGTVYEGNFNNNLMDGFGKIVYPDGKEY